MKQIISNRRIVNDDWRTLDAQDDIGQLPAGKWILPLSLWREHGAMLSRRGEPLAILLDPEDEPDEIAADLPRLAMVVLQFPGFRDGRAYSQARRLRLHHGYTGEIRACGEVLRDQLMYMERVGFTSFDLAPGQGLENALNAFDEITVKYQGSSDEPLPLYRRRSA